MLNAHRSSPVAALPERKQTQREPIVIGICNWTLIQGCLWIRSHAYRLIESSAYSYYKSLIMHRTTHTINGKPPKIKKISGHTSASTPTTGPLSAPRLILRWVWHLLKGSLKKSANIHQLYTRRTEQTCTVHTNTPMHIWAPKNAHPYTRPFI